MKTLLTQNTERAHECVSPCPCVCLAGSPCLKHVGTALAGSCTPFHLAGSQCVLGALPVEMTEPLWGAV